VQVADIPGRTAETGATDSETTGQGIAHSQFISNIKPNQIVYLLRNKQLLIVYQNRWADSKAPNKQHQQLPSNLRKFNNTLKI